MNIKLFWKAVLEQDRAAIKGFFQSTAYVNWHCTNECFTVDEFIQANCEYPGDWDGVVERVELLDDLIISVTLVYPKDQTVSYHVVSFLKLQQDKIISLDEYWADDGNAPQWRLDKHIGKPIKE